MKLTLEMAQEPIGDTGKVRRYSVLHDEDGHVIDPNEITDEQHDLLTSTLNVYTYGPESTATSREILACLADASPDESAHDLTMKIIFGQHKATDEQLKEALEHISERLQDPVWNTSEDPRRRA